MAFSSIRTFQQDDKTHYITVFQSVAICIMLHVLTLLISVTIVLLYLTLILLLLPQLPQTVHIPTSVELTGIL